MRRRQACIALGAVATSAHPAAQPPASDARRLALSIASQYVATPTPHYVNALLVSAQRHLGRPETARTATAALREAVNAPGYAMPTDWPRLAGYAALAEAATLDGDTAAGALAVQALRSVLADTAAGPRLAGLRSWTDDMFMATLLLDRTAPLLPAQERKRAAVALTAALLHLSDRLQRPDGLFDHAEASPVAWGRGNGFASLALAQALAGPLQGFFAAAPLLGRLQNHLHALLPLQAADGLWRQVLDQSSAQPELTVTAMSVTALTVARSHGWLPAGVADAAVTRAWAGMQSRIDATGGFRDVCAGTPAGPTLDFYLQRPIVHGRDDRAAAMVLLAVQSFCREPGCSA